MRVHTLQHCTSIYETSKKCSVSVATFWRRTGKRSAELCVTFDQGVFICYLINKRLGSWCWNRLFGCETIHPTENFEPMNLLRDNMGSKKIQPPTSKFIFFQIGISTSKFLIWDKKLSCQPQKCELELCMSNGSKVMIIKN